MEKIIMNMIEDGCTLILGVDNTEVEVLRPHTPYKKDGKEKMIDSVEFEIDHHGIEKLEENIDNETEYVMCFVHFDAGTENLDGIYFSVWNEDATQDDAIVPILNEDEKKILVEYALEELKEYR